MQDFGLTNRSTEFLLKTNIFVGFFYGGQNFLGKQNKFQIKNNYVKKVMLNLFHFMLSSEFSWRLSEVFTLPSIIFFNAFCVKKNAEQICQLLYTAYLSNLELSPLIPKYYGNLYIVKILPYELITIFNKICTRICVILPVHIM